jgi:hypothetical protein
MAGLGVWVCGVVAFMVAELIGWNALPSHVGLLTALAIAVGFAVTRLSRPRHSSLKEWAEWLSFGDPRFFPFRSEDEVRAAGGEPAALAAAFPCPRCGYELGGTREPGCPECGLGRLATSPPAPAAPTPR